MADDTRDIPTYAEPTNDEEFRKRYGERVGLGQSAAIYARDGRAAKVYRESQPRTQAFMEAFYLAQVGDLGIPAPKVYGVETFQGRTAVIMDQIRSQSLLDIMMAEPGRTGECLDKVVEMQVAMHKVTVSCFRPLKMVLAGNIAMSPGLTPKDKDELNTKLAALPDGLSICHGDFHGGNILFDGSSYWIIDWAEVACGSPAGDACRTYMDYAIARKDTAEWYLQKYCAASGLSQDEILAWLPMMAGSIYGFLSDEFKKRIRSMF